MPVHRFEVGANISVCFLIASLIATFGLPIAAHSGPAAFKDVLAPLVATPIAPPNPVLGSDEKTHLAYEIVVMNIAPSPLAIDKIETLDADSGAVIATLEGDDIAQVLRLNGGVKGSELEGGGSGIVFMDVTIPGEAEIPKAIRHRFSIAVESAPAQEPTSGDRDPAPPPAQKMSFVTDPLQIGPEAIAVAPPLKGSRWVVGGGCCSPPSYHRGATLPINGAIRVAERFAIDFVQLNDDDMLYEGKMDRVEDYAYFGDEIYSVADGTVVGAEDGLPEQVPGKLPEGATIDMAAGNHVVVDIGGGRFAFYAHMQPGSLRVKVGDKVTTRQVLGLLGNTGNTDTPHLHFHVMDGPSPLVANGLPYVFTSFSGQGRITDEKPLFSGGKVPVDTKALAGPHRNQLPLDLEIVSFP